MPRSLAKQFADSPVCPEWSEHQNPVTEMTGCAKGRGQTASTKQHFLPAESSKCWVTPHFWSGKRLIKGILTETSLAEKLENTK